VLARYDPVTATIVPDIPGVDLDVESAQQLMDAAVPGTYAALQLTELPAAVSDEALQAANLRTEKSSHQPLSLFKNLKTYYFFS
jgi:exosome complex RNA-binding protein Rrp42 (RNase PH superfamily)